MRWVRIEICNKRKQTDLVRQAILQSVEHVVETDRAEASLIDLSFQSSVNPARHVWIGVYGLVHAVEPHTSEHWDGSRKICMELEEWEDPDDWANTLERCETMLIEEAVQIVDRWLNKRS